MVSWFVRSAPPSARTAVRSSSGTVGSSGTGAGYCAAPSRSTGDLPDQLHAPGPQLRHGRLDRGRGHAHGVVEQHPGAESGPRRVQRGGANAMIGGDPDDIDVLDAAFVQPRGERLSGGR